MTNETKFAAVKQFATVNKSLTSISSRLDSVGINVTEPSPSQSRNTIGGDLDTLYGSLNENTATILGYSANSDTFQTFVETTMDFAYGEITEE